MLKGIDISKWQGQVNWDAIKGAVDFAIFKASTGCPDAGESAMLYADKQFIRNRDEARRVGILRGFYHFARPDVNGGRAEDEANCFCDVVGDLQDGEVMVLDYETDSSQDQVDWSLRFLRQVERRTGFKPLLYIDLGRNNAANWSPVVNENFGLWIARWDYNPDAAQPNTDWPFAAMRQYSNKGNVAGINPCDLDVFYGSAEQFKKYGKQPVAPVAPVEPPIVIPEVPVVVLPPAEEVNKEPEEPVIAPELPPVEETPAPVEIPQEVPESPVVTPPETNIIKGDTMDENKPGVQTTEFWTPIISLLGSLAAANLGGGSTDQWIAQILAVVAGVGAVIYIFGRIVLKMKSIKK